jgi:hypothetical protein
MYLTNNPKPDEPEPNRVSRGGAENAEKAKWAKAFILRALRVSA